MIVDHGAANTKLAKIAKQQNIALPDGVGEANVAMAKKLAALDGAAFDAAYMKGQVIAHEQTIALFKREIADGKDVLLVGFAKTTLPTVEQHLAMLQTKMESSM
jgi:putative membrane protein